jgi:phosphoribosylglycinamide formyltransferase
LVKEIPFQKGRDEDVDAFGTRVHEIEWGTVIEGVGMVLKELQGQKQ